MGYLGTRHFIQVGPVLVALSVLLWVAAGIRLSHIARPFWLDEWSHSYVIQSFTHSFSELRREIATYSQPWLEYAIRKTVLGQSGHHELDSRLLSLFWGLAAVAYTFLGVGRGLKRASVQGSAAWVTAFIAAVWVVSHPGLINYSVEARHYSFVVFASVFWFIGVAGNRQGVGQWLADFLIANAHFFSWPFVFMDIVIREFGPGGIRKTRAALHALARISAFALLLIFLNAPSLLSLISHPPGEVSAGGGFASTLWNAITLEVGLWKFLRVPVVLAVVLATGCQGAWRSGQVEVRRALLRISAVALIASPVLFVLLRSRSAYSFPERYYLAWSGVVPAIFMIAALGMIHLFRRKRLIGSAFVLISALSLVPTFAKKHLVFSLPERDFSVQYEFFKNALTPSLTGSGRLIFVGAPCYADHALHFYWSALGGDPRSEPEAIHESGEDCRAPKLGEGGSARLTLDQFFRTGPGDVVLHQVNAGCPDEAKPNWPGGAVRLHVDWHSGAHDGGCHWLIRNVRSASQVQEFARSVGFPKL